MTHLQLTYPVHWTMCIAWDEGVHAMPHCVASGELEINSTHPRLLKKKPGDAQMTISKQTAPIRS